MKLTLVFTKKHHENMHVPIVRSGDLRKSQTLRYNATSDADTILSEPTSGVILFETGEEEKDLSLSVNPELKCLEKKRIRVSFYGDEEEDPIEIDNYGNNCIVMLNSNDNEIGIWTEDGVEPRAPDCDSSSSDMPSPFHQETESDLTAGQGQLMDIVILEISDTTSDDTYDAVTTGYLKTLTFTSNDVTVEESYSDDETEKTPMHTSTEDT